MAEKNLKYKYEKSLRKNEVLGKMNVIKLAIVSMFSILLVLSAISVSSAASTKDILFISLNYKDNSLSITDMASGKGFIPSFSESRFEQDIGLEKASISIFSESGLLYTSDFYIDNKRFMDIIDEQTGELSGGLIDLNDVNFTISVPYFKDMSRIEIDSDYNKIVLTNVKSKYDLTKKIDIPTFKEDEIGDGIKDTIKKEKEDNDENETKYVPVKDKKETQNDDENEITEMPTDELSEQKKSIFFQFVEIVNSVWYYIFG